MRIEGLYDLRTFKTLIDNEIKDFGFDFRPTSFNFFQQYRFMKLIAEHGAPDFRYYLHFSNEADFVITKFIDDLKHYYKEQDKIENFDKQITLEFSDNCKASFYDSFEVPYLWNYHEEASLNEILDAKYLKGIIFDYQWLHEKKKAGEFDAFFSHFLLVAGQKLKEKNIQIGLKVDWDSHLFSSLFDYFDFSFLSLPVNEKIEVCYRNVDLNKASKNIHFYKSQRF